MKIQLTYDRLSQIKTDLLVVILDEERTFRAVLKNLGWVLPEFP